LILASITREGQNQPRLPPLFPFAPLILENFSSIGNQQNQPGRWGFELMLNYLNNRGQREATGASEVDFAPRG